MRDSREPSRGTRRARRQGSVPRPSALQTCHFASRSIASRKRRARRVLRQVTPFGYHLTVSRSERYPTPVKDRKATPAVRSPVLRDDARTAPEDDLAESLTDLAMTALRADPTAAGTVRTMLEGLRRFAPALADRVKFALGAAPTPQPVREAAIEDGSRQLLSRSSGPAQKPILTNTIQRTLEDLLREHRMATELAAVGLNPRRSLLLIGAPGVGKTTTARWLAHELQLPLAEVSLPAVVSSMLGRTSQNVHDLFQHARTSPVVLFLDEFDALSKHRDDPHEVGEMKRAVSVLLKELDSPPNHGLIIGATNHPKMIDPAMKRRFELTVELGATTADTLVPVLQFYLDCTVPSEVVETAASMLCGEPPSTIRSVCHNARRRSALNTTTVHRELLVELAGRAHTTSEKKRIAQQIHIAHGKSLSLSDIARLVGVSKTTIHSYVRGKNGGEKETVHTTRKRRGLPI